MGQGDSIAPGTSTIMMVPGAYSSQSINSSAGSQNELNNAWAFLNSLSTANREQQNNYERSRLNALPAYEEEIKNLGSLLADKTTDPEYQRISAEAARKEAEWNASHGPVTGGSYEILDLGVSRYNNELNQAKAQMANSIKIMNSTKDINDYNQAESKYIENQGKYYSLAKLTTDEVKNNYKDTIRQGWSQGINYAAGWGPGGQITGSDGLSDIARQQKNLTAADTQNSLAAMATRLTGQGQRLTNDQIADYVSSIQQTGSLTTAIPQGLINQINSQTKSTIPSSQSDLMAGWAPVMAFPEVVGKESQIKNILDNPSQYSNRQVLEAQNDYRKLTENNIRLSSGLHHYEKTIGEKYDIPMFNPFDQMGDIALQNQRVIAGVDTSGKKYQLPTGANYYSQVLGNQLEFKRQFGLPSDSSAADIIKAFEKNPNMIANSPYGSPERTNLIFQGFFPANSSQVGSNLPDVKLSNWYNENIGQSPSNLNKPFKIANEGITSGTLDIFSEANAKRPFLSTTIGQTNQKASNDFLGRDWLVKTPLGAMFLGSESEKAQAEKNRQKLASFIDVIGIGMMSGGTTGGKVPEKSAIKGLSFIDDVSKLKFSVQKENTYSPFVNRPLKEGLNVLDTRKMSFSPPSQFEPAIALKGGSTRAQGAVLTEQEKIANMLGSKLQVETPPIKAPIYNPAAAEEKERIAKMLGSKGKDVWGFSLPSLAAIGATIGIGGKTATIPSEPSAKQPEEFYKEKVDKYEADVKKYTEAGSSDKTEYDRLKGEENNLKVLNNAINGQNMMLAGMANYDSIIKSQQVGPLEYNRQIIYGVRDIFTKGDILGGYEHFNTALSKLTSPALPYIENLRQSERFKTIITPSSLVAPLFIGQENTQKIRNMNVNFITGAAKYGAERPLDVYLSYFVGKNIGGAENTGGQLIAGAAERNIPLISRLARAGSSSPMAHDIYAVATKVGLPTLYGYTQGSYVMAGKDEQEKSERLGESAVQIGAFTGGMLRAPKYPGVNNAYYPKEYTPLEKGWNKLTTELSVIGKPIGEKTAIRNIFEPAYETRFVKPAKTTGEIDLTELTKVKTEKNAAAIKAAAASQPSVMYGSGTIRVGASELPSGKRLVDLALPSKDYDAFANDPVAFREFVAGKIGGRVGIDADGNSVVFSKNGKPVGIDIHPFGEGYPNVGQTNTESVGDYLFGKPQLKINPYIDEITRPGITPKYKGKELSYEQLNVQGSKSFNDLLDNLQNPMERGYRIPKSATRAKYIAEDLMAVAEERGLTPLEQKRMNSAKQAMDKTYEQRITYKDENGAVRTETINEAMNRFIQSKQPVFEGGYTSTAGRGALGKLGDFTPLFGGGATITSPGSKGGISSISKSISDLTSSTMKRATGPSDYTRGLYYGSPSKIPPSSPKTPSSKTPSPPSFTPPSISGFSYIPPSITPTPTPTPPSKGGSGTPTPPSRSGSFYYQPPSYFSITSSPPSSSKFYFNRTTLGTPFLAPPGAGGGGGRGRGGFDIVVQNPLQRLIVAKESTAQRFTQAFSGSISSPNKNLFPQNRGNVNPIMSGFKIPQMKQAYVNKPQKQSKPVYNMIDMFSMKKKGKRGMAF